MKTYKANEELKELLIRQGFHDTTSCRDKRKGKSTFKLNGRGKKEIYFDYENIQILENYTEQCSKYTLTENELKSIILFFNLKRADYKLIDPNGDFDFKQIHLRLIEIENELQVLTEKDIRFSRRSNLVRILRTFENIKLD